MVALSNIRCTAHGQHFTVSCKRVPLWKFGGEYFFFGYFNSIFIFFVEWVDRNFTQAIE